MSGERQVSEILSRYTRAADNRDAHAMSALFAADAVVEVFNRGDREYAKVSEIQGAEAIGNAVAGLMAPHPPRGWSHHTTFDQIITVDGDEATLDAQFIVYNTVGAARPAAGWPEGMLGAQGTIIPIEAGYYRPRLRCVNDAWKIFHHQILHDIPYVFPGL
jgi:SnoaL-like domain